MTFVDLEAVQWWWLLAHVQTTISNTILDISQSIQINVTAIKWYGNNTICSLLYNAPLKSYLVHGASIVSGIVSCIGRASDRDLMQCDWMQLVLKKPFYVVAGNNHRWEKWMFVMNAPKWAILLCLISILECSY